MDTTAGRLLAALSLLGMLASAPDRPRADPVVVELFTSQGCSSCPPADALLGELAQRDDVLPLAFHVTYWDRLGWADTFGLEASAERQAQHAARLGLRGLYTPQMVIGGRYDVVGSLPERVLRGIELLARESGPGPSLRIEPGQVLIGSGEGEAATVWLAAYDRRHEVRIERGENRGRTLTYQNVVRAFGALGSWAGQTIALPLPADLVAKGEALAVWLERDRDGLVLAATSRSLSD